MSWGGKNKLVRNTGSTGHSGAGWNVILVVKGGSTEKVPADQRLEGRERGGPLDMCRREQQQGKGPKVVSGYYPVWSRQSEWDRKVGANKIREVTEAGKDTHRALAATVRTWVFTDWKRALREYCAEWHTLKRIPWSSVEEHPVRAKSGKRETSS